jgi:DNA-binding MarR family transcriptional regulator
MDKVSEAELRAWRYFIKSYAYLMDTIERELSAEDKVPLSTYDVLIALFEAPEHKLRLGELTQKLVITKSGVTRLLDRLEREGLVVRQKSEEDRRGSFAVLTPEGETQMRRAWPVYARGIKQYFAAGLTPEQIEQLTEAFGSILEGSRRAAHDPDGSGT